MPTYQYLARDSEGNEVHGRLKANSTNDVAVYLSKSLLLPVKIEEVSDRRQYSLKELIKLDISFKKGISNEELLTFSRNMSVMMKAGVPILQALQQLGMSAKSPKFKTVLLSVLDMVKGGNSLSEAFRKYPDYFSSIYVNAIEVGESSGKLDEVFLKLTDFLEMEDINAKRLKSTLRYPKLVISAMLIAMIVINLVVVPSFSKLFSSFGADLPLPTRILIATSNFLTNYWFLILGIIVVLIIFTRNVLKQPKARYKWDRLKFQMPVFGPLILKIMLTRFIWSLSLMIKSGFSLPKSMDLVASSTGNLYLEGKIRDIKQKIESSKSFSQAVGESKLFDPVTMQMMYVGDETGELDTMLEKISLQYDKETAYTLKHFSDMIEPILLLILGVMVAVLALAVFLPLWDLGRVALKQK